MKRKDEFTKDEILELFCNHKARCNYCVMGEIYCNANCYDNVKAWFEQEIVINPILDKFKDKGNNIIKECVLSDMSSSSKVGNYAFKLRDLIEQTYKQGIEDGMICIKADKKR